ncbi:immune-associated nucleotide-binding protein 13-like [Aplysia californica]|uniref:Immune-associated nucleotide-binding protein 13-like n=1 Tax=Aplysia californica TaxID=6500 RepID=A0ABM0JJY5_APLCA|nr:immune-associated nucleotide-binding protein 13-like [Aplysia californica]
MSGSKTSPAVTLMLLGTAGHGKTATAASLVGSPSNEMIYDYEPVYQAQNPGHDPSTQSGGDKMKGKKSAKGLSVPETSGSSAAKKQPSANDEAVDQIANDMTTDVVRAGSFTSRDGALTVNVLDSPGLFDSSDTDKILATKVAISNIEKGIKLSGHGVNAFAIVLRYAARYTEEEQAVVHNLETIFGSDFFPRHVILIFTRGDDYRLKSKGAPFSEWWSKQTGALGKLIQRCNNNCLLFENVRGTPETDEEQKNELLRVLSKMTRVYTTKDYNETKVGRETLLSEAKVAKRVSDFERQRDKIMQDFFNAEREHGRKKEEMLEKVHHDVHHLMARAHKDDRAAWQRELREIEKVVNKVTSGGDTVQKGPATPTQKAGKS